MLVVSIYLFLLLQKENKTKQLWVFIPMKSLCSSSMENVGWVLHHICYKDAHVTKSLKLDSSATTSPCSLSANSKGQCPSPSLGYDPLLPTSLFFQSVIPYSTSQSAPQHNFCCLFSPPSYSSVLQRCSDKLPTTAVCCTAARTQRVDQPSLTPCSPSPAGCPQLRLSLWAVCWLWEEHSLFIFCMKHYETLLCSFYWNNKSGAVQYRFYNPCFTRREGKKVMGRAKQQAKSTSSYPVLPFTAPLPEKDPFPSS